MVGALFAVPFTERWKWFWGAIIVTLSILLSPRLTGSNQAYRDVLLSVLVGLSILGLRRATWTPPVWLAAAAAGLAAVSYSTYLIHAPVMNAMRTVLERSFDVRLGRDAVDAVTVIGFFGFVAFGILAGVLCYFAFERHTMTVRRWLKSVFLSHAGNPA